MGLVLWIDQNTFVSDLVERVFKQENLPFYSLGEFEDFTYLIDDLKPTVIVLDLVTAVAHAEVLGKQYHACEALRSTPVITIGSGDPPEFVKVISGKIDKPFNPFELPKRIAEILKTN
ncbi:MAG TPA: hypothetical protein VNJ01_16855 [Bacteriovoracaceae bacterium]|nr:hypothetical protein [Bacteriovoracaceae bacterium]